MRQQVGWFVCLELALSLGTAALAADDATVAVPEQACIRPSYQVPIAFWAVPSNTPAYVGYYVGGGCAWGGEPRHDDEGTYGWDYVGSCFARRVWLAWCHCTRYQGGTGAYATDGIQPALGYPTK